MTPTIKYELTIDTLTDEQKAHAAQDAAKAADLLDDEGWCQGSYHQYVPSLAVTDHNYAGHCLVGAVTHATRLRVAGDRNRPGVPWGMSFPVMVALDDQLDLAKGDTEQETPEDRVVEWNDTDGRTKDEVTAALRDLVVKLTPDASGATLTPN